MSENEFKSAKTLQLEQELEASKRRDKIMWSMEHEVLDRLTQEEKEILFELLNERLHGDD